MSAITDPNAGMPPGTRSHVAGDARPSFMRGQLTAFAWLGHLRSSEERQAGTGSPDIFDHLAQKAADEPWDSSSPAEHGSLATLKHYVTWTFERALTTQSVVPNSDSSMCVFNTGLMTPQHEDIHGIFHPNLNSGRQDWYLRGWRVAGDSPLDTFPELPPAVTYSEDPYPYLFDWDLPLKFTARNFTVAVADLFPAALKEIPFGLELALEASVDRAIKLAKRHPGTAVPAWQPDKAEIQLLLPLSLVNPRKPDAVLVIARGDMTYRSTAIVPPAEAYKAARLITRPTARWLDPCG
ncbi:DUF3825 domain-containing protein [Streptomyces sp. NPDC001787]|uniref:DUF3825 domain-containing protein n=1 Tax=Streptomyces sp. NPDC001787 TaxID=3154523 RepID=UPI00333240F8